MWKREVLVQRVHGAITNVVRLSLIIAFLGALIEMKWMLFFVSGAVFFLTYIPEFFERKYRIYLPVEFEIVTVLFIYGSLFLGEAFDYYNRFWWWDLVLHAGSAVAVGFIGFAILFILYKRERVKASPIVIAVFSFSFAVAIGAVWEIFEFSMDLVFGMNMQKSGLIDTMGDLIIDSIGALIAAAAGYFYIKKGEVFIFDKVIDKFVKENPRLFKKTRRK